MAGNSYSSDRECKCDIDLDDVMFFLNKSNIIEC